MRLSAIQQSSTMLDDAQRYPAAAAAAKSAAAIRERQRLGGWQAHPAPLLQQTYAKRAVMTETSNMPQLPKAAVVAGTAPLKMPPTSRLETVRGEPLAASLPVRQRLGEAPAVSTSSAAALAPSGRGSSGLAAPRTETPASASAPATVESELGCALLSSAPFAQGLYRQELTRRLASQIVAVDSREDDTKNARTQDDDGSSIYPAGEAIFRLGAPATVAEVLMAGAFGVPQGDIVPEEDRTIDADIVRIVTPRPRFRRVWREGQAVQSEMKAGRGVIHVDIPGRALQQPPDRRLQIDLLDDAALS